jgi:hypothetical protein
MADRGHSGPAYQDCRRYVLDTMDTCCRCGGTVDKGLSGRHPWGPTLDLIVPWSRGGTMTRDNSALSHNRCNSAYRDGRQLRVRVTQGGVSRGRYAPSGSC